MHLVYSRPEEQQPKAEPASLLRLGGVEARTGLKKSTIYRLMRERAFPQPVLVGTRSVAWLASEVDAWCASRPRRNAEGGHAA